MVSKILLLFLALVVFGNGVKSRTVAGKLNATAQSCLDYLKEGFRKDGYYSIYDFKEQRVSRVYCDMNSEEGSAWTLVMSFAFKNKAMTQVDRNRLGVDAPLNEHSPNWDLYRMSLSQMTLLKSQSTHWRSTCSFPTYKVDYTDYVRAKFADFDVMAFLGTGTCEKVEFVNIRGHQCAQCTTRWLQSNYLAHIDSSYSHCQLVPTQGSVKNENNFGFYTEGVINKRFRCTANPLSSTNWWLGGYL